MTDEAFVNTLEGFKEARIVWLENDTPALSLGGTVLRFCNTPNAEQAYTIARALEYAGSVALEYFQKRKKL